MSLFTLLIAVHLISVALTIGFAVTSFAQDSAKIKAPLALGKIEPYKMDVTYDKTSHLIFPSGIMKEK